MRSRPSQSITSASNGSFLSSTSAKLCLRSGFPDDKGACSAHIHDTMVAQFSCQDAWAERPVSANVDAPEKNNQSHDRIIGKAAAARKQELKRHGVSPD